MAPPTSTTTAATTLGSRQRTKSSFGQASTSLPSITRVSSGVPHLTQKWPTGPNLGVSPDYRRIARPRHPRIVRTIRGYGGRKGSDGPDDPGVGCAVRV